MRSMGHKIMAVVLGATVLAGPAAAGDTYARSEVKPYNYTENDLDEGRSRGQFGATHFQTKLGERFVTIDVRDVTGNPVAYSVGADEDGDSSIEGPSTEVCPEDDVAIPIRGGIQIIVYVSEGICDDGSLSVPVTGEIEATFTK